MKARNLIITTLTALGLLFLLAGCSTIDSRIAANQAYFDSLKPEQKELIKKGEVAIGFDAEMVKMAVGDPDNVREKMDMSGRSEVWGYTTWESDDGMLLYRGYYHRHGWWGRRGGYYYCDPMWGYPYFDHFPNRRVRDYLRVTFRQGRVIEIDREVDGVGAESKRSAPPTPRPKPTA